MPGDAVSHPTASPEPSADPWGSFMSAYAPIDNSAVDSSGNTVAVPGIDVAASACVAPATRGGWIIVTGVVSIVIVPGVLSIFGRKPEDAPETP
ncbi:MAG: hypothetical protein ABR999_06970 [Methanoregula sp.]|jgi:hypothetical protein|uniref:hypothetical protein n=1 Tax=Methanoregula sp. TaxID=2052170 RepID=UPI003D0A6F16